MNRFQKDNVVLESKAQPSSDGIDRRNFLGCMAWAGTGLLWTMAGGVPSSKLLAQAVNNLIDNALKYTPAGGTVTVTTVRPGADAAAMVVTDSGPGMTDAQQARATERFFRGDASRGTPGVGLGLSLVQSVARLHGGTLEFADLHPGLAATISFPSKA